MSRIIIFNMMSLNGFFEGKNSEIDWHNVDSEFNDFATEQLDNAAVLIFGRKTYELMAGYWPSEDALKDDPRVAEKMNSIPKIVFSRTLFIAEWNNTRIFMGNIEDVCNRVKKQHTKDIFIFGSATLASAFIDLGLIDEFRIMINPVILGQGNLLFKERTDKLNLKLLKTRVFNSGNVLLSYEPVK